MTKIAVYFPPNHLLLSALHLAYSHPWGNLLFSVKRKKEVTSWQQLQVNTMAVSGHLIHGFQLNYSRPFRNTSPTHLLLACSFFMYFPHKSSWGQGEFTLGLFLFSVFNSKVNSPLNKTTALTLKEKQWGKEELSPLNGLKRPAAPFLIIPCKLQSEWVRRMRRLFYLIFITLLKKFLKDTPLSHWFASNQIVQSWGPQWRQDEEGAPSASFLNEVQTAQSFMFLLKFLPHSALNYSYGYSQAIWSVPWGQECCLVCNKWQYL